MPKKVRKEPRKKLGEVIDLLSSLRGVDHSFYLTKAMRTRLAEIEKNYPSIGPLTIRNDGVFECLRRSHVACIIKDKSFRAPPHPTVLLIDEVGNVIGRELLPGEKVESTKTEKVIMLGKDFAVFFRKGTGRGARFILPSVPFKELEELDGVKSVSSSSPSTAGDMYLRKQARLKDNPKLASILIGFDLA